MKYPFLLLFVLLIGCETYETTDFRLYVVGKVTGDSGLALTGVDVNLSGLLTITDQNGCFVFNGVYPEVPMELIVSKAGYKTVKEEKPFGGYFIDVTLAKDGSSETNRLNWSILDISDPNLDVKCE